MDWQPPEVPPNLNNSVTVSSLVPEQSGLLASVPLVRLGVTAIPGSLNGFSVDRLLPLSAAGL